MSKVSLNSTVTVNYTGKLEDGSIFDSSLHEGREPLKATLGQGQLIPGFESGLLDMTIGDKKTVEIPHTEAYGDHNEDLITEIPKDRVPEGVQEGAMLQTSGPNGPVIVKVVEVKENVVVLDANHPLAGQKLIFDLELLEVE
jgi:FKBP-type peptidyl-prolyl cis-trans isomerase SlpA